MLTCAPTEEGKRYVVHEIIAYAGPGECSEPAQDVLVANQQALAISWLTNFLFVFAARSHEMPSEDLDADDHITPTTAYGAVARGPTLDHEAVLRHDGFECVVTGDILTGTSHSCAEEICVSVRPQRFQSHLPIDVRCINELYWSTDHPLSQTGKTRFTIPPM